MFCSILLVFLGVFFFFCCVCWWGVLLVVCWWVGLGLVYCSVVGWFEFAGGDGFFGGGWFLMGCFFEWIFV